jgi:hypothetical protein
MQFRGFGPYCSEVEFKTLLRKRMKNDTSPQNGSCGLTFGYRTPGAPTAGSQNYYRWIYRGELGNSLPVWNASLRFLIGYYLKLLDNALATLDDVIKPSGSGEEPKESFTQFLVERVRLHWSSWVLPLSLAAPIILALVADGCDILGPLQSQAVPPSCSSDWSAVGYTMPGHPAALWYLAFNFAAWTMQVFFGYCGARVLALTGAVLGTVFRYGLGGQRVVDVFRPPAALPVPDRYNADWKYCLPRWLEPRFWSRDQA